MKHTESSIQQACVAAFRAKYPYAAKCLIHVKNEEAGGVVAGGIHKAEGVVAGAPDLLLLIPSQFRGAFCPFLCIEMKSAKGRVRDSQLLYRTTIQCVGSLYIICRSLDEFMALVDEYMAGVSSNVIEPLKLQHRAEDAERINKARQELKALSMNNNKPRPKKSVSDARKRLAEILS